MVMLVAVIPWQIASGPQGYMSPRLVPTMMIILIMGLSVLLVLTNLRRRPRQTGQVDASPISHGEFSALVKILGVSAVALGLYLWLSPLAAGFALVAGTQLVLGERNPLLLILMPAGFLLAIWFLFYKVLGTAIV